MKHSILLILLSLVLAVSCSTTMGMVNEVSTDPTLSLEEKLDKLGYESVEITYPEVIHDGRQWQEYLIEMLENTQDYFICTVFLGSECDENQ